MKLQPTIIKKRRNGRITVVLNGFTKGRAKRYIRRMAKRLGYSCGTCNDLPEILGTNIDVWCTTFKGKQVRIIYWNDGEER